MGKIYGKLSQDSRLSKDKCLGRMDQEKLSFMQEFFNAPISNQRWRDLSEPKLSVVVLGFRKASLLKQALESFYLTARASSSYEVVLVLNGAAAEVVELAKQFSELNQFPLLIVNQSSSRPGTARNAGVRRVRAPITLFLDDDIICFQDMVTNTLEVMASSEIAAAGGPNLTPPSRGNFETATGLLFSSWLGAFQMRQRYQRGGDRFVDEHSLILCNLAVRTDLFRAVQGFPQDFISNEENVVLQRLEQEGHKLWFTNKLAVYHERRATWAELSQQAEKYGAGRAQNILLLPNTLKPFYFLPLFFLFYLLSLPLILPLAGIQSLVPLTLYLIFTLLNSAIWGLKEKNPNLVFYFTLYPVVHLSYAWGFLKALSRERIFSKKHVTT